MRSTFHFVSHPKLNPDLGETIEADGVDFESGWVIFYEIVPATWLSTQGAKRIIKAVHKEACHDLREEQNDDAGSD